MSDSPTAFKTMTLKLTKIIGLFAAVLLSLALVGCGGDNTYGPTVGGQPPITVSISPNNAPSVGVNGQIQFTATVTGTTNTAVTWTLGSTSIRPHEGTAASLTQAGLFTAGTLTGTYTVTATSQAKPSVSASVTVTVNQPIAISLSPNNNPSVFEGSQLQFTATVTGTTNTAVTWKLSSPTIRPAWIENATLTQQGLFTADPTVSAFTTVTVTQPITITVSPAGLNLDTGESQQYTATVSGGSSSAVNWSVSAPGGAAAGSISSTGLYTTPQNEPQRTTVTITATLASNNAISGSTTASVENG
jgi:hypothetical protein